MLELTNVSCGYNNSFVLSEINCRIADRELVGIIGPNGSGKTTLIRVITKILKPATGTITLQGQNLETLTLRQLAQKVAVVGKLDSPDLRITVEELVLLGRIPHRHGINFVNRKIDMNSARLAMNSTGILGLKDRMVESLSSGERQLAFIARALAQEPALLLLDEPTSHLDIAHQVKVLDLVKRLNKERGLTVMVVLHDLNLASQYCDRLLLLQQGRLYRDGKPKDVLSYGTIEDVYGTVVVVRDNPVSHKPYIFLVSEEDRERPRT